MPRAWHEQRLVLQVVSKVWWYGCVPDQPDEGHEREEPAAKADGCVPEHAGGFAQGSP